MLGWYPEFPGLDMNRSVSIASCSMMAFWEGVRLLADIAAGVE